MPVFSPEYTEEESAAIAKEFQRVADKTYLDHAGATLYTENQVDAIAQVLKGNLFGNPHTCKITGNLVDQVRYRILQHFNADSSEYAVVFTANATAALKTVAECFQFEKKKNEPSGSFYYCQENHTSVLGMRDLVQTTHQFVLTTEELLQNTEVRTNSERKPGPNNSLIAFSAQCNFSGFKMPLEIIRTIQKNGLVCKGTRIRGVPEDELDTDKDDGSNFYVCLDTASFVASNYFDLQRYKPDFCCISFYKIFGFPTGVGALIVSKRGQAVLEKKYYGGGTVKIAMTRQNFHEKRQGFTERFEDGTLAFLSIASLLEGFRTLDRLIPRTCEKSQMERISAHVFKLAKYCHDALAQLHHSNGAPLIKFYNHTGYKSSRNQGGIVTFNVLHDDGMHVGFAEVACIAAVHNVQLRTGCFCNPGACQHFLQLTDTDIRKRFEAGHVCSDFNDLFDVLPTGAVRISFGYMTRLEDVEQAIAMIRDCYLTTAAQRLQLLDAQAQNLPQVLQKIPQRLRPQLKRICIYPIKSCAAYTIEGQWLLTDSGFQFDNSWIIADSNGVEITQRHNPLLSLLKPIFKISENLLELSFPQKKSISIPLDIDEKNHIEVNSYVSEAEYIMYDCGDEVSFWLDDCLEGEGLRLMRNEGKLSNHARLSLINRTSVRRLTTALEGSASLDDIVDRFRAHFIIETSEALEENLFEQLSIGNVGFEADGFSLYDHKMFADRYREEMKVTTNKLEEQNKFGIYLRLKEMADKKFIITCKDVMKVEKRKISDD